MIEPGAGPMPGGKREARMMIVMSALLQRGGTYLDLARRTGLSVQAVGHAVTDLHLYNPSVIVSIPCPHNGYTVGLGWNLVSRQGEGNQARHLITRLERAAVRWDKAAAVSPSPAESALLRRASILATGLAVDLAPVAALG